jgi:hypothetical protein
MRQVLLLAVTIGFGTMLFAADAPREWTGYITDTHCGAKGAVKEHTVACVEKCMRAGSKAQILNEADHAIYNLDSFAKVKPLMGNKVTVTGSLDSATHTIVVESARKAAR